VTPVLLPNVSTVEGIFPGRGQVTWRDFYTHATVDVSNSTVTLSAPLGHINVHVRGGSALLLHASPAYTTTETRAGPFSLLVSLESTEAFGTAYLDDGVTNPPSESRIVTFTASGQQLRITSSGDFTVEQTLEELTILGVAEKPNTVSVGGKVVTTWEFIPDLEKLVVSNVSISLNSDQTVSW